MAPFHKLRALYLSTILVVSLFSFGISPVAGAAANNTVSGTVTDAGNTAIGSASVDVIDTSSGTTRTSTATAGDGTYSVSVPDGTYRFKFDATGYLSNTSTSSISTSTTIDASLTQAGTIAGAVTNKRSGSAISGATIQISNNTLGVSKSATTDGAGQYSIDVQDGMYTVDVDASNYVRSRSHNVGVTVGQTTTRDSTLTPAGTISGSVTNDSGTAIPSATITVSDNFGNYYSTSTDQSGNYAIEVPKGSYTVKADNQSYAPSSASGVSVAIGSTTPRDFTLNDAAVITGTVSDQNGNTVSGATISAWDSNFENFQQTTTDSQGNYELEAANGTYTIEASKSGYALTRKTGIQAVEGQTTTQDIDFQSAATVTGTVTDSQGNPLASAKVVVHDSGYQTYQSTQTNAQGQYTIQVPEGNYTIRAEKTGYAREQTQVSLSASQTTTKDFALGTPAVIEGTVTDSNGNQEANVFVLVDDGETYFTDRTDKSGDYSIDVPAGNYSVTAFKDSIGAMGSGGALEAVETGKTYTVDIGLQNPSITNTAVKHVGGTQPNMASVDVNARVMGGMMMIQLVDGKVNGMPHDLSDSGVDRTTKFEITVTVEDYDPNTLLWGVRDVSWSTSPNTSNPQATDITIQTKAVNLQGINGQQVGPVQDYESISWPTGNNDKADLGWNKTVYFGLFDMSNVPSEIAGNVENMTIATNAQTFSRPQVTNYGLKVYVAGPHLRTNGVKHDGFYNAFIPNDQLDAWGVDDPKADLNTLYKGDSSNFNVEETSDGVWIKLDISYSDGTVEVEPDPTSASSSSTSSNGNGGGGGSVYTATPTTTPTPSSTPVVTSTPQLTPAPTPTATQTSGPVSAIGASTSSPESTVSSPATDVEGTGETPSQGDGSMDATEKEQRTEAPGQSGFGIILAVLTILGFIVIRRYRA